MDSYIDAAHAVIVGGSDRGLDDLAVNNHRVGGAIGCGMHMAKWSRPPYETKPFCASKNPKPLIHINDASDRS